MFVMILKMTGIMLLIDAMILCVYFLEKKTKFGLMKSSLRQIIIGLFFGVLAILSTHFGVRYDTLILNVRDMAPLCAGLMFGPWAGIIAGLLGGAERLVAGLNFGVGAYSAIACSVSTALAGILSAALNKYLFEGKKPTWGYSFAIGGVMEVFHMLAIFLTHMNDVRAAYEVVNTCAAPMILFTALGMMIASLEMAAANKLIRESNK
jgi:LytS/YehU family sensor histidine kinase